jgi:hypothetical protein
MVKRYDFMAPLWRHAGEAAWYFVTLPHDVADEIDQSLRNLVEDSARSAWR